MAHNIDKSEILEIYETSLYFPLMIFADGVLHCMLFHCQNHCLKSGHVYHQQYQGFVVKEHCPPILSENCNS